MHQRHNAAAFLTVVHLSVGLLSPIKTRSSHFSPLILPPPAGIGYGRRPNLVKSPSPFNGQRADRRGCWKF